MIVAEHYTLKRAVLGVAVLAFGVLYFHFGRTEAEALPMFARRYGVECAHCHTNPPRLNEVGYNFRAAGFRMPEEIGHNSDRAFKITDYIGFRLQPRLDVVHTREGSETDTKSKGRFFVGESYIWYGPIGKYLSSSLKVSLWPEEFEETEGHQRVEGNIRFNYGNAEQFVDIRAGVPHPLEGYGGSEYYVVSNSRPFIHELRTANFNQDTFFQPIGMHQSAITVGYHYKKTTVRGLVMSGVRVRTDDDSGSLEGFGRKDPFSDAFDQSNDGGPDFQLFLNQILHPDGGGISLYYYKGQSFLPRLDLLDQHDGSQTSARLREESLVRRLTMHSLPQAAVASRLGAGVSRVRTTDVVVDPDVVRNLPFFENDFNRLAFYAGYPIHRINLLYGIQRGRDETGSGGSFTSLGQFGEAMARVTDMAAVGVRFDWFDPARNKPDNDMNGFTSYVNVWLWSQLRVTPEYQYLSFEQGPLRLTRKEHVFQFRLYWVK